MAVEKNIESEELTNFHETLQNLSPNTNGEVLPFRNILMEENIASLQSHPKSCKQWTMEKRHRCKMFWKFGILITFLTKWKWLTISAKQLSLQSSAQVKVIIFNLKNNKKDVFHIQNFVKEPGALNLQKACDQTMETVRVTSKPLTW